METASGIMASCVLVLVAATGLLGAESWRAPVSHFSGSNITYPADYAPNGTAPGDPGAEKLDPRGYRQPNLVEVLEAGP